MSLSPEARLGPYEILSLLGAGGMGEVYKARDTRLDRFVAIKVLPSSLSASADARQRLEREAKVISQIAHPHICALYDIGHESGINFLVMELLEGETLAARLARGPLPLDQILRFGIEMCDALDAAHRQGIAHRDLKPGNVMLTRTGLKLLDFGLARAFTPLSTGSNSGVATAAVPAPLTQEGSVLGTLQYMAPEQLEGRAADARTDIFALGTTLYEMATGTRAFGGTSGMRLAAAILNDEPKPISSLQPSSPPALDRLIRVCVAKDPEQRWQSAHDVGLQLASIRESGSDAPETDVIAPRSTRWMPWVAAPVAAVVGALLAVTMVRPAETPRLTPTPIRFAIPPPEGASFLQFVETISMAVSPDGSQVAFVASPAAGERRVWLRPFSAVDARPLDGTDGATTVFWSPDGRSIGFVAGNKLRRLDLRGGAAVTISEVPTAIGVFATWGSGGDILFATIEGQAIFRVSTAGGSPVAAITPDRARDEVRVVWPSFLPDGRRFLYQVRHRDGSGQIMLAEPGKPARALVSAVSNAHYVEPGYLVFAREGALLGQRVDLDGGRVVGDPFSIAQPVQYFYSTSTAVFAVSREGTLLYASQLDRARLAWIDRAGQELSVVGAPGGYQWVRISPDGRRAIFDRATPGINTFDLWSADLGRGVETRLTSEPSSEVGAVFLPGGNAVVFGADRGGPPHLFRKDLMTGAEAELLPARRLQRPNDIAPDGTSVLFSERTERGNFDLWTAPLAGGPPSPLLQTPFDELDLRVSPDGRVVTFQSDDSGRMEIYAAPFGAIAAKTRVSSGGGRVPRWSRDGRELFFLSADGQLVSAPVRTSPSFEVGVPVPIFTMARDRVWRDFDVSADGKKFLAVVPELAGNKQPLTVVLNWTAEIGR